jgi:hypothetical protein
MKPPFDDEESRRIKNHLFQRAEVHLAAAVKANPNGRGEVHLVIVARGERITIESYIEPAREHAPSREELERLRAALAPTDSRAKTA